MAKRRAKTEKPAAEAPPVMHDLPEGWTRAPLSEVTVDVPNAKPEAEPSRMFRYIDIGGVDNKSHRVISVKEFSGKEAPSRARRPVQVGDVLFSNVRTYLRNIVMVSSDMPADLCSTGFTVLRTNGAIDPRFLFYAVLTDTFIEEVSETQTGSQYPATSDRHVRAMPIPVPPLAEQTRIADRIEALLQDVDAARDRLAKVPGILKRFRQSILAAACCGDLTTEWRGQAPGVSPQDAIATVLEARSNSRHGKRRRTHERFFDPVPVALDELPELPDFPATWVLSTVGFATDRLQYGTSAKSDGEPGKGVPNIGMQNIQEGRIDLHSVKHLRPTAPGLSDVLLAKGDLLFNRTNSPDLVGKSAVYRLEQKAAFASYLIRAQLNPLLALPEFVCAWINGTWGRAWAQQVKADAVSQSNINGTKLAEMPLPIPPVEEQKAIVASVAAHEDRLDSMTTLIKNAGSRVGHLAQALFGQAFRGELVITDAELAVREGRTFESGDELLRRIRETPPPRREPRVVHVHIEDKITFTDEIEMKMDRKITATHLRDILKKAKTGMPPERLLDESGLDVDDFYTQLKREVEAGHVRERRKDKQTVILEAVR